MSRTARLNKALTAAECNTMTIHVCPSVTMRYDDHIGWNTSKIISRLINLGSSLSVDSNIVSLRQREHHEMAEIGVDYGESSPRHSNYVISNTELYTSKCTTASRNFLRQHGFRVTLAHKYEMRVTDIQYWAYYRCQSVSLVIANHAGGILTSRVHSVFRVSFTVGQFFLGGRTIFAPEIFRQCSKKTDCLSNLTK